MSGMQLLLTRQREVSWAEAPQRGKGKKIMSMKLYVGNLAFQTSSDELQTLFSQAGTVESVSLIEDRETGRSRGFGFVEMSTKEEGAAAIQQFNGKDLGGRALNVNEAKPREDRGGGGGGRNGGSRY
jgi:cold-inducible RNA-binding protein